MTLFKKCRIDRLNDLSVVLFFLTTSVQYILLGEPFVIKSTLKKKPQIDHLISFRPE